MSDAAAESAETPETASGEYALRRMLSDELHARAFYDFEGAGRFVRFVFLTGDQDGVVLDYVNEFLAAEGRDPIDADQKFQRVDLGAYALRLEKHTEFVSISFIERGLTRATGLLDDAFDAQKSVLPLAWARATPVPMFHAIWLEIGGKAPRRITSSI